MAQTTTAPSQLSGAPRSAPLSPNAIGLLMVVVLAPLLALVVSSAEFVTVGALAAALTLLLVVLWSAEATFYVLIFSMLLSPEFIVGSLESSSQSMASRGITLRFDDYIISIIALAWLVRLAVYKEAAVFRRTPLNAPIAAYISVSALATLFGALTGRLPLLTGFFYVLKYLEYTVIYFLVVNYVRDRDQVRRLLTAAVVTAVIIAIVAIVQIPSGARVTTPFEGEQGEANTLGGYLVLLMAIVLALLAESRTLRERVLWLGVMALMLPPLMYTFSRTSWLAFCGMLGSLILISRRRTTFLLLGSIALVALIASPPTALIERAAYTLSSHRGSLEVMGFTIEPSAAARLQAWAIAAQAMSEYPLTGAGVTGYGLIDAQYPRVIAETGFIGLGVFFWMIWRLAATGFELNFLASTKTERVLATGFLAGLAGMLVHGIGANTFIIVRIMEPLWLLAGLVGASLIIIQDERRAGLAPPETAS